MQENWGRISAFPLTVNVGPNVREEEMITDIYLPLYDDYREGKGGAPIKTSSHTVGCRPCEALWVPEIGKMPQLFDNVKYFSLF